MVTEPKEALPPLEDARRGRQRTSLFRNSFQVLEDFVEVLFEPSTVFSRRRDAAWQLPLFILTLLSVAFFALSKNAIQPLFDSEFTRQMASVLARNPDVTAEQISLSRSIVDKTRVLNYSIGFPVTVIAWGFVFWVLGKLAGSRQSLRGALAITTYAQTPRLIEHLTNSFQGLYLDIDRLTSQTSISLGPARFMDIEATNPVVLSILSRLDVFSIWITLLLAIGLHVASGVDRRQAILVASGVWAVSLVPQLLAAAQ